MSEIISLPRPRISRWAMRGSVGACAVFFVLSLLPIASRGQATVETIGGAFAGYVDGDNTVSQFNTPFGLALDTAGNLFIADRGNNVIRKLDPQTQIVTTFIPRLNAVNPLNQPTALAIDQTNNVYVANEANGVIFKFDFNGNLRTALASGLDHPTALALDSKANLYVALLGGAVIRVTPNFQTNVLFVIPRRTAAPQLRGLTLLDNGNIVVSDAANHAIYSYNPAVSTLTLFAGGNGPGFAEGPVGFSRFNQPHHVAKGPNGTVLVADRLNARVRVISCDGEVSTVYGIDPSQWFTANLPGVFPGWEDGSVRFAEAREPVGVVATSDGIVFASEVFYHVIRRVSGFTFPAFACGGGGGASNTVAVPILSPNAGYFPAGVDISVTSPPDNPFGADTQIFYTLNGDEPTTNSLQVPLINGQGTIHLRDPLLDLTALRVKAFAGRDFSPTVSGQPVTFSNPSILGEVGIPIGVNGGTTFAGIGSTIVLPVVSNLRSNVVLRSLQFLMEVRPENGAPPITPPLQIRPVAMSANDFIQVVAATRDLPTTFSALNGPTNQLALAYIGTNQVFSVRNFGTVAMLAFPIPPAAHAGQRYTIRFSRISGTSDGVQGTLPLVAMPSRTIEVQNLPYLVGDSSPGSWYNAGDFGDGRLDNSDVNNAFYASLGFRLPYVFSDLFDAMDVFPEDTPPTAGGDGRIRFLDWQTILRRSLGLAGNNYLRMWADGGFRISSGTNLPDLALLSAESLSSSSSSNVSEVVWHHPAVLGARTIDSIAPSAQVSVPVYVKVRPDASISGMQFAVYVSPAGSDPGISQGVRFQPALGIPAPRSGNAIPGEANLTNGLYCAWDLGAFPSGLSGSNLLGQVIFTIPSNASQGARYVISFANADGAQDGHTQVDFDTLKGSVWIKSPALQPPDRIPDEWKQFFFGSVTDPQAQADADPDGDGFSNLAEYFTGFDPLKSNWRLRVNQGKFAMRWFSQAGIKYEVQRSSDLKSWTSVTAPVNGIDFLQQFSETNSTSSVQFYRLKTQVAP